MISNTISRLREIVFNYDLLTISYCTFIALIFLAPDYAYPRNVFYFFVLPCFLLVAKREIVWRIVNTWTFRFAAAFAIYVALSMLWAIEKTSWHPLNGLRLALIICAFLLVTAYLATAIAQFKVRLFRWIVIAASAAAILKLAQWASESNLFPLTRLGIGLFPNPNVTSAVYGTVLAGAFFYVPSAGTRPRNWIYLAALGLAAFAFLLTQTRGSIIAFALAVCFAVILMRSRALVLWLVAGTTTAALALVLVSRLSDLNVFFQRLEAIAARLEAWQSYFEIWRQHPWFGIGAGGLPEVQVVGGLITITHPHNIYLTHLLIGGIPGLVLLICTLIAAAYASLRHQSRTTDAGLIAMLLFLSLAGLFDFSDLVAAAGWQWMYFWLPFGLIAGAEMDLAADQTQPA